MAMRSIDKGKAEGTAALELARQTELPLNERKPHVRNRQWGDKTTLLPRGAQRFNPQFRALSDLPH